MSYLVFARKWRPQTFDDVVGQEHITRTLQLAIEKNRVAHAYIFSGTRGVGKTTTARILARALNCDNGPTPTPCGSCDSCRTIIQGSNFDVLEIDGASNNSVDDIRDLRENINYSSMGGKYRIYVIDEVHMLTKPAFNALLKTLEEPPKNVIFIFATTEPQKIPETILSRCQRYDFRRISPEQILGQLEKICTTEGISFDREGLMLIARKADGSMRDSLSLLDQVFSFCGSSISEKDVRSVLGIVNTEIYLKAMDAVNAKDAATLLNIIEEALYAGYDLHEFITGFQDHLRTLLFFRIPGLVASQKDALSAQTTTSLTQQCAHFAEGDLLRMSEILRATEHDLKWSSFPRFLVEVALCKMAYLDSSVSIEQLLNCLHGGAAAADDGSDVKKKIDLAPRPEPVAPLIAPVTAPVEAAPIRVAVPAPAAPVTAPAPVTVAVEEPIEESQESEAAVKPRIPSMAAENLDSDAFIAQPSGAPIDLKAQWPKFIEMLVNDRPNLGTFLSMAAIVSATTDSIDLRFAHNYIFQFAEITKKGNREAVEKKLNQFAGYPVNLRLTLEKKKEDPAAAGVQPTPFSRVMSASLEDDMETEPVIKNVIDIFKGEIV
jgi:DNA polymerase-3 subunit gamma/tau